MAPRLALWPGLRPPRGTRRLKGLERTIAERVELQMLLSHRDPHLTLGGLVARLVRDGLHRYDPARPPGARRTGRRGLVEGAQSASRPARGDVEAVQRNEVRAHGADVERQSEIERGATSLAADANGTPRPSAAKRHTQAGRGNTKPAPVRDGGGRTVSAAKRRLGVRARQRFARVPT